MLEKVKSHVKEHKEEILFAMLGTGVLISGYFIGSKCTEYCIANGIEKMCLATPGLKPMLEESVKKVMEGRRF